MFRKLLCTTLPMFCAVCFCGCAQPKMDMSAMKPPPRPAELDKLEPWVGKWESTSECTVPGMTEKMTMTGEAEYKWELDRRFLVEHGSHNMGEMGTMEGVMAMTYCPGDKMFHSNWFSSWGETATGTMTYDEAKKCWCMTWKGHSPMDGSTTVGEGCMKFLDNNTVEWCFTEYDAWKWNKHMEMKGTMKRKM